jgi:hypothetical protein
MFNTDRYYHDVDLRIIQMVGSKTITTQTEDSKTILEWEKAFVEDMKNRYSINVNALSDVTYRYYAVVHHIITTQRGYVISTHDEYMNDFDKVVYKMPPEINDKSVVVEIYPDTFEKDFYISFNSKFCQGEDSNQPELKPELSKCSKGVYEALYRDVVRAIFMYSKRRYLELNLLEEE